MTNENIDVFLEQVGAMTGAVQKLLDIVGDEIGYFDEKRVLYVSSEGEPCYMDQEDAYKISGGFADRIEYQYLGDSDYVAIYDCDERIVIDGDTYLLGNYIIAKDVDDMCAGVSDEEIEELEAEFRCCLRPFVLGDETVMALLL